MFHPHATVLDDHQLATLRRAAAMAHTTGAIGLRLSAAGVTIADVVPHPTEHDVPLDQWRAEGTPGLRIDPCAFRLAVARAWEDHGDGRRVGLIGLDDHAALTVTWTVGPPGKLLGFGAARTRCASRMVWAFASLLAPAALSAVLTEVAASAAAPSDTIGDALAAQLIHDELLDATVVHVELDPAGPPASSCTRMLDEVLRRMVAAVGAAEVIESFS